MDASKLPARKRRELEIAEKLRKQEEAERANAGAELAADESWILRLETISWI